MKSKAVVGPPTTSNIPATIIRHKTARSSLVEIEAEEEVQLDIVLKTPEEVISSQTTDAQLQPEQDCQSDSRHCDIQSDEEVPRNQKEDSTDTINNRQLVLASFFESSPLQEVSLTSLLPGVPAGLSAEFFEHSLDTTIAVPVKRATDLYRSDTSPAYIAAIQGLDAQTGALVLFRPKPQRRSSYHLLQTVEDLSEHPEPFQASNFEEQYHVEEPTTIVLDVGCIISPNETSHSWSSPQEVADIDDSEVTLYSTASLGEEHIPAQRPDTTALHDLNREILRLKAEHRVEVARLKLPEPGESSELCR